MEKTEAELLKETGGVMTSQTARGSPMNEEEPTQEDVVGNNKHDLNGDL